MKKPILLFLLATVVSGSIRAQSMGPSTLNAAGGYTTIGSDEYEWSVGEMTMVTTLSAGGITVTQGVLQPADVTLRTVATSKLSGQLHVFPNPATNVLNVQYTAPAGGSLNYQLMDMAGKIIKTKKIDVLTGITTEQIDVSKLAVATYMLEVSANPKDAASEKMSYKIDKLK